MHVACRVHLAVNPVQYVAVAEFEWHIAIYLSKIHWFNVHINLSIGCSMARLFPRILTATCHDAYTKITDEKKPRGT